MKSFVVVALCALSVFAEDVRVQSDVVAVEAARKTRGVGGVGIVGGIGLVGGKVGGIGGFGGPGTDLISILNRSRADRAKDVNRNENVNCVL